ncbi:MAG: alpha-amylase family glycosyl hydrolase [Phocaeicola sp.]
MKRLFPLYWSLLLVILATACSTKDDELTYYLTPTSESELYFTQGLSFDEKSASANLSFSSGQAWQATLASSCSWCTLTPERGEGGHATVVVTVQANSQNEARETTLTLVSGNIKKSVKITQLAEEGYDEGLTLLPTEPQADSPLTLIFKASTTSALYNYTGQVYAHIGVVTEGTWKYVPAAWDENTEKCNMAKIADNTWSLTLSPSIREWFASGTTPIEQIGLVVRSADGKRKGEEDDLFIAVTDHQYQGFQPADIVYATMPSGLMEGINIIDPSTVTLVLYDLDTQGNHKDYAHLVGDFNNWTLSNDEASQMKRDQTANCWWITVNNLDYTKEYAFQYYVGTKGGEAIRLGDAYAEKILDPDNDSYIPTSTYGDNKTYPEGAIGIASVFQTVSDNYTWQVTDFKIAQPNQLVIYELLIRDFSATSDLNGVMAKLDYLVDMGVNAIELMPTQEFDGNDSWGYNPCYFFAMDKAYGTKQLYKQFIDACHQKGIAVILDVVYNHATGAMPFAKLYWDSAKNETTAYNPYFNVTAPHPYSVFHDFNHESPLVRTFVKRNLAFLLEEYKLDGFRFDLTKGFTQKKSTEATASNYDASRVAILKDYYSAIEAVNRDAFVILEHFCDTQEETELATAGMYLWRNLNHAYCQSAMGWYEASDFSYLYSATPNWVGYMESHDEERMAYKQTQWGDTGIKGNLATSMKQLQMNTAFFLTTPGPKMIWQFGELGYDFSINSNQSGTEVNDQYRTSRKPLRWDYLENSDRKAVYEIYAKLMELRNAHPELFCSSTAFTWKVGVSDWDAGRSLHSSSTTGKELVVVGNFTNTTAVVDFPAATGNWHNYLNQCSEAVEATVQLPAHSFVIYTNW